MKAELLVRRRVSIADGKGDHLHRSDTQMPYVFTDIGKLLADFRKDVERHRHEDVEDQNREP